MKYLVISICLILLSPDLLAQTSFKDIKKYLVEQGVIEKDFIDRTSVYAFELLNNNKFEGTERYGIFRIGIYADHSLTYLLLLNDGNHMFLDCFADLSQTLNSVFIYFERVGNQLTDAQKLLYIHKIVDVYIRNRNCIPW